MTRLWALLLLGLAFLKTLGLRYLLRRRPGLARYRANYEAEGGKSLTREEQTSLETYTGCVACGLCDRGESRRIAESGGAYPGVMTLVLSGARSTPDFAAARKAWEVLDDATLASKERICPAGVPLRAIAAHVKRHSGQAGER